RSLERVRDVSLALGLATEDKQTAPLQIPALPDFTATDAASRLALLQQTYPQYDKVFMLRGLPDAIRGEVQTAAKQSYDHAIAAGRDVVLRRLREAAPGNDETPDRWRALSPWLTNPTELA